MGGRFGRLTTWVAAAATTTTWTLLSQSRADCNQTVTAQQQQSSERHLNTMLTDYSKYCNGPESPVATVPDDVFVSIFISSRDKVTSLRKTVDSIERTISSPYEIIILDHDSAYPEMLTYLRKLEERGIQVVHLTSMTWEDSLKEKKDVIRQYLEANPHVDYFVHNDDDVALLRTAPDALLFYAGLLEACPKIQSVGPGLQISDIPSYFTKKVYNEKKTVEQQHSELWTTAPNMATWNGVGYHIVEKMIDTTFAMFRRGHDFERLAVPSFRAYAPYAAVHVDWYDDSDNLPADKIFYVKRQSGVNHWR